MKKKYFIFISLGIIIFVLFYINFINIDPFNYLSDRHKIYEAKDLRLIDIKEKNDKTVIYSVGKVNKRKDNMYFVDILRKTLSGYKWITGRGHIDKEYIEEKVSSDFVLSAQSLLDSQYEDLIVFGMFRNPNIKSITLKIQGISSIYSALIYDIDEEKEKSFIIDCGNIDLKSPAFLLFNVTYKNNATDSFFIKNKDEINMFFKGDKAIYLKMQKHIISNSFN